MPIGNASIERRAYEALEALQTLNPEGPRFLTGPAFPGLIPRSSPPVLARSDATNQSRRESLCIGQVAQLVEQRTENPRVGGSIPPLATI